MTACHECAGCIQLIQPRCHSRQLDEDKQASRMVKGERACGWLANYCCVVVIQLVDKNIFICLLIIIIRILQHDRVPADSAKRMITFCCRLSYDRVHGTACCTWFVLLAAFSLCFSFVGNHL